MIPAELADRIDDAVHLSQRHPIHLLVQLMEIRLYPLVIVWITLIVALIEHGQDGISITKAGRICFDMSFQFCIIWIYNNIPP